MKKFLVSALLCLSIYSCNAAEAAAATQTKRIYFYYDKETIEVSKEDCNHFLTLRNSFDDLEDVTGLADVSPQSTPMRFGGKSLFRLLINYAKKDLFHRKNFLDAFYQSYRKSSIEGSSGLGASVLPAMLKMANFYNLDDALGSYTDLTKVALTVFSPQQLEEIIPFLDPVIVEKALKKIRLETLLKPKEKRALDHAENLGEAKVQLLKDHALWISKLSIKDIATSPDAAIQQLLVPETYTDHNGNIVIQLTLSYYGLTSLDGLKALPNLDTITHLELSHNQLTTLNSAVFATLFPQLETLYLGNNQIARIEPGTFSNLPQLRSLWLDDNQITHIEVGVFANLPELNYLDLQGNKVTTIHTATFNHLPRFRHLDFTSNKITTMEAGAFTDLPAFKVVRLDCNELTEALPESFVNVPLVGFLYFSKNRLRTIDPTFLAHFPQLKVAHFDKNLLTTIPSDTFSLTPLIEKIHFSHNKITSIESGTFDNLFNLEELHLNQNELTMIDPKLFAHIPFLQKLYLNGNHLQDHILYESVSGKKTFGITTALSLMGLAALRYNNVAITPTTALLTATGGLFAAHATLPLYNRPRILEIRKAIRESVPAHCQIYS